MIGSQCYDCKHYEGIFTCPAFPDGIPKVIFLDEFDHREPYPGDHGVRFESVPNPSEEPIFGWAPPHVDTTGIAGDVDAAPEPEGVPAPHIPEPSKIPDPTTPGKPRG